MFRNCLQLLGFIRNCYELLEGTRNCGQRFFLRWERRQVHLIFRSKSAPVCLRGPTLGPELRYIRFMRKAAKFAPRFGSEGKVELATWKLRVAPCHCSQSAFRRRAGSLVVACGLAVANSDLVSMSKCHTRSITPGVSHVGFGVAMHPCQ